MSGRYRPKAVLPCQYGSVRMSRRFSGVTSRIRASCEITTELSNTKPAWKELEYAARTRAQSASIRHACRRQAGCDA